MYGPFFENERLNNLYQCRKVSSVKLKRFDFIVKNILNEIDKAGCWLGLGFHLKIIQETQIFGGGVHVFRGYLLYLAFQLGCYEQLSESAKTSLCRNVLQNSYLYKNYSDWMLLEIAKYAEV